jgi:hypothetical protein
MPVETNLNLSAGDIDVNTSCAYGYTGTALAVACDTSNANLYSDEYSLTGCTKPACVAGIAGDTCDAFDPLQCDSPSTTCRVLPRGLAEKYSVTGGRDSQFGGQFARIKADCNGSPVYENGAGYLLLRQSQHWVVAPESSQILSRCCPDNGCVGYAVLSPNEENGLQPLHECAASPDGSGCAGGWRELLGEAWRDAPGLSVVAA